MLPPGGDIDTRPRGKTWMMMFQSLFFLAAMIYFIVITQAQTKPTTENFTSVIGDSDRLTKIVYNDTSNIGYVVSASLPGLDCSIPKYKDYNLASFYLGTIVFGTLAFLSVLLLGGILHSATKHADNYAEHLVANSQQSTNGMYILGGSARMQFGGCCTAVTCTFFFYIILWILELAAVITSAAIRLALPEVINCNGYDTSLGINGWISTLMMLIALLFRLTPVWNIWRVTASSVATVGNQQIAGVVPQQQQPPLYTPLQNIQFGQPQGSVQQRP